MRKPRFGRVAFMERDGGAAIVEFAIVLPLLLLLVFGIIDFGRALYIKNNLTSAVRSAGRVAAVQPDPAGADRTKVRQAVAQNAAEFGSAAVDTNTVTVTAVTTTAGKMITVTISNYPLTWITPLPKLVGYGDTLKLSTSSVFRWEMQ